MVKPGESVSFNIDVSKRLGSDHVMLPYAVFDPAKLAATLSTAVLWQEGGDGVTASVKDGVLTVSTSGTAQGNALVALKNGSTMLWSWHVWLTNYDVSKVEKIERTVETYYGGTGQFFDANGTGDKKDIVIMDRNLGATGAVIGNVAFYPNIHTDADAYGLYYQWGRKDPLKTSSEVVNGYRTLTYSLQNPREFINNNDLDWCAPSNPNFWGGTSAVKSPYDPCPEDWRMPRNGTWDGFTTKDAIYSIYPRAGFRYSNSSLNGAIQNINERVMIWSSSATRGEAPRVHLLEFI